MQRYNRYIPQPSTIKVIIKFQYQISFMSPRGQCQFFMTDAVMSDEGATPALDGWWLSCATCQWPLLLTWINFNPSMDHMFSKVCDEITYPFPNLIGWWLIVFSKTIDVHSMSRLFIYRYINPSSSSLLYTWDPNFVITVSVGVIYTILRFVQNSVACLLFRNTCFVQVTALKMVIVTLWVLI